MYHVTINGTFEVVADREELYNLLEQQEGLREAIKLLQPKHITDIMTIEQVLTEVEILTDSNRFNYSEFWRCI